RPTYRSRMGAQFRDGLGRPICRVPSRRSCECRFSGSALHPTIQGVPMQSRLLTAFASLLLPALAGTATPSSGSALQRDKLVILSTTDVKGKTGPCGCHVPKGGLARRAGLVDSIRTQFGQVALVDAGGFFPEADGQQDLASFLMDAMSRLNTDAVGVAERDLRYGTSFLSAEAKRSGLPVVCANLIEKVSGKPLFDPYLIKKIGGVKVGFFGL